jgi:hypothetical protein
VYKKKVKSYVTTKQNYRLNESLSLFNPKRLDFLNYDKDNIYRFALAFDAISRQQRMGSFNGRAKSKTLGRNDGNA